MKLLICDPISEKAIEEIKALGIDVTNKPDITPEELLEEIGNYDGIIVRSRTKVRQNVIDRGENLKFIIRGGVGLDNIDVEYAKSKGIKVLNTPAASSISVAELAIGFMFALSRHIVQGTTSMRNGEWLKKKLKGSELYGKTLGIIGIGRIGREVARRAIALGMKVISYDPYVDKIDMEGVELVDLDTLLSNSDFITLHIPHTDETHHLIGKDAFEKMKDGVYLINCARGGVVDEEALYEYMKSGKVKGAGFDVFEKEPPENLKLLELENFICTPHIGASTKEGQARVGEEIVKILKGMI